MTEPERAPRSEEELEDALSRPSAALVETLSHIRGDLIVLGAGGKMGPSLARMAKRADPARRVIAVSRWSSPDVEATLQASGIETLRADLRDPAALASLPAAPNVVFMAGQKFGTSGSPATTWAMNAAVPAFVAERYSGARTVVFSTGNVYPLSAPARGGSNETEEPAPVGEYAYSCLARERLFAAGSARHGTLVSIVRLNYAHDLRYGVLTDIASRIAARQPVSVTMGYVNVIWQGDANAFALAALTHATAPEPYVVNVAGPAVLRVADLATALGTRLGIEPEFAGTEGSDALLSQSTRMSGLLDQPLMPLDTLLDWVADWVGRGGPLLNKPTGFEKRDGRF
jgi:nucleoside-diphosphate-sugar epimerase